MCRPILEHRRPRPGVVCRATACFWALLFSGVRPTVGQRSRRCADWRRRRGRAAAPPRSAPPPIQQRLPHRRRQPARRTPPVRSLSYPKPSHCSRLSRRPCFISRPVCTRYSTPGYDRGQYSNRCINYILWLFFENFRLFSIVSCYIALRLYGQYILGTRYIYIYCFKAYLLPICCN